MFVFSFQNCGAVFLFTYWVVAEITRWRQVFSFLNSSFSDAFICKRCCLSYLSTDRMLLALCLFGNCPSEQSFIWSTWSDTLSLFFLHSQHHSCLLLPNLVWMLTGCMAPSSACARCPLEWNSYSEWSKTRHFCLCIVSVSINFFMSSIVILCRHLYEAAFCLTPGKSDWSIQC